MRKLVLMAQVSVDGYITDKNGNADWMIYNWGEHWTWDYRLREYFKRLTASADHILLSQAMAGEGYTDHWTNVAADPNDPRADFARNVAKAAKTVFAQNTFSLEWLKIDNGKALLIEEVKKLKKQPGKKIMVYGNSGFAAELIMAGLVDEYQLFINPTLLGEGQRIFKSATDLKLLRSRSFPCGMSVLKYKPAVK